MRALCQALRRDESGQDTIEYVLLALLISVVAVVAIGTLGTTVNDAFEAVNDDLEGVS